MLTNLFRDQLDRYGEVEPPGRRLARRPAPPELVGAGRQRRRPAGRPGSPRNPAARPSSSASTCATGAPTTRCSDVAICPRCATMLEYTSRWLSQLGDYRCPSCGFARPPRDLEARDLRDRRGARGGGGHRRRRRQAPPPRARPAQRLQRPAARSPSPSGSSVDPAAALRSLAAYQPVFGRWSLVARGDTDGAGQPGQEPGRHEPDAARPGRGVGREGARLRAERQHRRRPRHLVDLGRRHGGAAAGRRPGRDERHAQARDGAAAELRRRARRGARHGRLRERRASTSRPGAAPAPSTCCRPTPRSRRSAARSPAGRRSASDAPAGEAHRTLLPPSSRRSTSTPRR